MDVVSHGVRHDGLSHLGLKGRLNPKASFNGNRLERDHPARGRERIMELDAHEPGGVVAYIPIPIERRKSLEMKDFFPVQAKALEASLKLVELDGNIVANDTEIAVLLGVNL